MRRAARRCNDDLHPPIRRAGREPLLHLRLFGNRAANLGLGTQAAQWLTMQGTFFVTAVYLQNARGYNAILTGLVLMAMPLDERVADFQPQPLRDR